MAVNERPGLNHDNEALGFGFSLRVLLLENAFSNGN